MNYLLNLLKKNFLELIKTKFWNINLNFYLSFQFRNIQVGEYHGDVDCDMRGKMPVQLHPLPDKFKHLEDVFHVNFLETKVRRTPVFLQKNTIIDINIL